MLLPFGFCIIKVPNVAAFGGERHLDEWYYLIVTNLFLCPCFLRLVSLRDAIFFFSFVLFSISVLCRLRNNTGSGPAFTRVVKS